MTEKEKMNAGMIYDPEDTELVALKRKAHRLSLEFNQTLETDPRRKEILRDLLGYEGNYYFQGPIQFDYGCFFKVGKNFYANFNFSVLDSCPVQIGDNVFFGPNCSINTPVHPFLPEERNPYIDQTGKMTDKEYAKPITIGNNCWFAANVVVCGGVTIGDGCVIGAGSVVTRDNPSGSLAFGNPCRVIRKITKEDSIYLKKGLF